jgi:hypothetical protein
VNDPAKLLTCPLYPYPQVARYAIRVARVTLKISRAPRLLIHDSFDIHAAELARSGHVSGHWK